MIISYTLFCIFFSYICKKLLCRKIPHKSLKAFDPKKQLNVDSKRALLEHSFLSNHEKFFPKVLIVSKSFCAVAKYHSIFRLCMRVDNRRRSGIPSRLMFIVSGISISLKKLSKNVNLTDLTFAETELELSEQKKLELSKLVSLITGKVGLRVKCYDPKAAYLIRSLWEQLSELVCLNCVLSSDLPAKNFDFLRVYGNWTMRTLRSVLRHNVKHLWLDMNADTTYHNAQIRIGKIESFTLSGQIRHILPITRLITKNCQSLKRLEINSSTRLAHLFSTNQVVDRIAQLYALYSQITEMFSQKVSISEVVFSLNLAGEEFKLEENWLSGLGLRRDLRTVQYKTTVDGENVTTKLSAEQRKANVTGRFMTKLHYKYGLNTTDALAAGPGFGENHQDLVENELNDELITQHLS